ncbi:MAG: hypothetical protein F2854_00350 [Actinobacteria bacterium]|nr:hypothetical protein [Actinomycetota bacterium]
MSCLTNEMTNAKTLLVKVPAVTLWFWIIKIFSTTVGETLGDTLNDGWGLGLVKAAYLMLGVFAVLLAIQLLLKKYVPAVYWATIIAVSTVGTLLTDNLHDTFGWQNWQSAILFGVILAAVFAIWWLQERTLSIKSINTRKREAFYWLAILATFGMGTAGGDIFLDDLGMPLTVSSLMFAGIIALVANLWRTKTIGTVFGFWAVYVLTRPLGASVGDLLSQPKPVGYGFDPGLISWIALGVIAALTAYLSFTKVDVITE